MGRETKLLLALLGLLAGVFVGVVSLKLFVPRPPAGVGPDVHTDLATAEAQDLVEPPAFAPPPARVEPPPHDPYADRSSRFGQVDPPESASQDPFVMPASFEAEAPLADTGDEDLLPPPLEQPEPPAAEPPPPEPAPASLPPVEPPASQPPLPGVVYVTQPGDSWWSIAERAYGDGRLYRALFAWNRALDPRVTLAPGTRLQIPPAAPLAAAWPALMPGN